MVSDLIEYRGNGRAHGLFARRLLRAFALAQLIVDTPDIFWLAMNQYRAAWPARRIEQRATDRRIIMVHADIGNNVTSLEILALQTQSTHRADGRARAVGRKNPGCL